MSNPTATSSASDAGSPRPTYAIEGGAPGRERLRVLTDVLRPSTLSLLGQVGVPRDARIVDLGCGGGDISRLLARLAPQGEVIGIDADPDVASIARSETVDAGLDNVEYLVGDVTDPDSAAGRELTDRSPFDLVYARFLLSHLSEAEAMLRRMGQWCRGGGVVVVEDIDLGGSICSPAHPSFTRACELYAETVQACGGDAAIGPLLPALLQATGLRDVEVAIAQPGGLRGDSKRLVLITLVHIAPTAIRLGLTTADEVRRLTASLGAHVDRPDTFITTARVIQTWGRA